MGYTKPIICEIAYKTYAINEYGMAACFVLVGTKRGLLIDTGCGMSDVRQIADSLCTLPYDVVLTHGHGDHAAGMDRWDEVWLHPADWDKLSENRFEAFCARIREYPSMMAARGSFDVFDITLDQVRVPERIPHLLPLKEGKIFDLGGGRKVEVFHTPGHTLGEVVLIDNTTRILFSGDACNPGLGIRETSVNTALASLLKLKALEHRFERNFNGHIAYGSRNYHISMPEANLDDDIHILRSIIDGSADVQTVTSIAGQVSMVEYNGMQVQFTPGRIIDPGENRIF